MSDNALVEAFDEYFEFHNLVDGSPTCNLADDHRLAFQAGWNAARKHLDGMLTASRIIKAANGADYQAVCVQYSSNYNGDGFGWTHFMHVPIEPEKEGI